MLALHFLFPVAQVIPLPWSLLGLVPLVAGLALNLIADNAFHKNNTTVKPFEESTVLIVDGVNRFSRHPMYLGFVLILIGVAILLGSLTCWVVVPAFVAAMEIKFIRTEENMLEEKFGPEWRAYKKRVRRWI
jgi:protein-S-isoprenylcysteine O-methyltransferase Ste14